MGGANDWRWMLGVMAIPSLIYTVMVITIPESPRWLVAKKNDVVTAKKVFERLGIANVDEVIDIIKASIQHETAAGHGSGFFNRKYKAILWLAFLVAFFNQWSGINFILYYAPEILERAGLAAKDSLLNSIAIGGTNLIFTFVGLYLIDRLGRKTLLIIGSLGYISACHGGMVLLNFSKCRNCCLVFYYCLLHRMLLDRVPLSGFLYQKFFQIK